MQTSHNVSVFRALVFLYVDFHTVTWLSCCTCLGRIHNLSIHPLFFLFFFFLGLTNCVCVCVPPTQVSQLYDVVQKWDAMSTSVPQVVQRLVAVKELHEQGNAHESKPLRRPRR